MTPKLKPTRASSALLLVLLEGVGRAALGGLGDPGDDLHARFETPAADLGHLAVGNAGADGRHRKIAFFVEVPQRRKVGTALPETTEAALASRSAESSFAALPPALSLPGTLPAVVLTLVPASGALAGRIR